MRLDFSTAKKKNRVKNPRVNSSSRRRRRRREAVVVENKMKEEA